MLAAAQGYYNGEYVVVDEPAKKEFKKGDMVILVRVNNQFNSDTMSLAEKRRHIFASQKYANPTGRSVDEIDDSIKGMRNDDRI